MLILEQPFVVRNRVVVKRVTFSFALLAATGDALRDAEQGRERQRAPGGSVPRARDALEDAIELSGITPGACDLRELPDEVVDLPRRRFPARSARQPPACRGRC